MIMRIFGIIILTIASLQSKAYQFEVDGLELGKKESPVHEQMTLLALDCFKSANGSKPKNCLEKNLAIIDRDLDSTSDKISIGSLKNVLYEDVIKASRWPDDPTRLSKKGNKRKTALKSVGSELSSCEFFRFSSRFPFYYWSDMSRNIIGGLFCNSHYGTMQFLHAMASKSPENNDQKDSFDVTLEKVAAWGDFSMRSFMTPVFLDTNMCQHFQDILDNQDLANKHSFASVFKLSDAALKAGRDTSQFHCKNNVTLRFVFNNECKNITGSDFCTVIKNTDQLRLAALGSVLHMIQDSYSSSHTFRHELDDANQNNVVYCEPVTEFYEYTENMDDHGDHDKPPITFDSSCYRKDNKVKDPITASAIALWWASQETYDESHFAQFLKENVLGISN